MQDTQFAPLAGHRTRAGHWADRPAVDTRVSRAEQDDHQITVDEPASFWMLSLWVAAPFLAIVLGIVASLLSR